MVVPRISIGCGFYSKSYKNGMAHFYLNFESRDPSRGYSGGCSPIDSKAELIIKLNNKLNYFFNLGYNSIDFFDEINNIKVRLKKREWKGVWFGIKLNRVSLKRYTKFYGRDEL